MIIPEYAQRKIARTNGRLWESLVGRLTELPIPEIPIPAGNGGLLLDIGCGWGRWMAASARRGYLPVGVDIQVDAVRASLQTLRGLGLSGYGVVADMGALPFAPDVFAAAWSFSVLQHAHRRRVAACLDGLQRCLAPGGFCTLEFPTRYALRNILIRALSRENEDDFDSWCVRYYSLFELRELMTARFTGYRFRTHCFFGTGILPDDLKHVPRRYAPVILASMGLARLSQIFPPLRRLADSVYVEAFKPSVPGTGTNETKLPAAAHELKHLLPILRCPVSGSRLEWDATRQRLVSPEADLAYPVVDDIPILVARRGEKL